jgi:hypothetical protein
VTPIALSALAGAVRDGGAIDVTEDAATDRLECRLSA